MGMSGLSPGRTAPTARLKAYEAARRRGCFGRKAPDARMSLGNRLFIREVGEFVDVCDMSAANEIAPHDCDSQRDRRPATYCCSVTRRPVRGWVFLTHSARCGSLFLRRRFGGCAAGGCHSARLSGCGENPGAAFDIISDGGEADLQTRLCEPSPAHASKAVASLPRSEDFFDAATNAVDRPVSSLKTRQRFRLVSTPHAGRSDAQTAALGLDGLAKSLSPIRAVGEYLA